MPNPKRKRLPRAFADQPMSEPRALEDIQGEFATFREQRESGRISESEFNAACAKLEAEVLARYGK